MWPTPPSRARPVSTRPRSRYKKKIEKDDDYLRQIKGLCSTMEVDIMQNYSLDIYQASPAAPALAAPPPFPPPPSPRAVT